MSEFILPYKNILPKIDESAFIAPTAAIIGDVEIGEDSSVWFGCTLRGDVNNIKIGKRTNIQDGTVIHTTHDFQGTYVGDNVTVGHAAILHACTVEDLGFVGMQACMLDGSVIETKGMLAAGALLTPDKVVPTGQLWAGNPAKFMRDLTDAELKFLSYSAEHYVKLSKDYL